MSEEEHESSSAILRNAVEASRLSAQAWCRKLHHPKISLRVTNPDWQKWVEASNDNPLERASGFVAASGSDLPLRWACGRAGGFLVGGLPGAEGPSGEAFDHHWFQVSDWVSRLRTAVYKAFQNENRIDWNESRRIAMLWGIAKGRIEGLVSVMTRTPLPAALETFDNRSLSSFASHEMIRVALDHSAFSSESIANELNLSADLVRKWGQRSGRWLKRKRGISGKPEYEKFSGSANPFDYVARIVEVSGDISPIGWLCRRAGGRFVPNPRPGSHETTDFWNSWRALHTRMGAFDETIGKAVWNGRIDDRESERIHVHWDRLKSRMEDFTDACEAEHFAQSV